MDLCRNKFFVFFFLLSTNCNASDDTVFSALATKGARSHSSAKWKKASISQVCKVSLKASKGS